MGFFFPMRVKKNKKRMRTNFFQLNSQTRKEQKKERECNYLLENHVVVRNVAGGLVLNNHVDQGAEKRRGDRFRAHSADIGAEWVGGASQIG
jgi:hypothetical protein